MAAICFQSADDDDDDWQCIGEGRDLSTVCQSVLLDTICCVDCFLDIFVGLPTVGMDWKIVVYVINILFQGNDVNERCDAAIRLLIIIVEEHLNMPTHFLLISKCFFYVFVEITTILYQKSLSKV